MGGPLQKGEFSTHEKPRRQHGTKRLEHLPSLLIDFENALSSVTTSRNPIVVTYDEGDGPITRCPFKSLPLPEGPTSRSQALQR